VRIVFIGASSFGLRCLNACIQVPDVRVVGIVTAPRRFSISYRPSGVTNVLFADFRKFSEANDIPIVSLHSSMSEKGLLDTVAVWKPEAFIVVGWYHMVPKSWRTIAPAYGLHASLLPDYSGGAPLVWAMINGETKTGITLFQMDDGVDSGPIVAQAEEPIYQDDTIGSLYGRVEQRGLGLLREYLPLLAQGKAVLHPQDESRRRIMPQRSPEDGQIDWSMDADFIDRFIRAQTRPYPGGFSRMNGHKLLIWEARCANESVQSDRLGLVKIIKQEGRRVACARGSIELLEVKYGGKVYSDGRLEKLFRGRGRCSKV